MFINTKLVSLSPFLSSRQKIWAVSDPTPPFIESFQKGLMTTRFSWTICNFLLAGHPFKVNSGLVQPFFDSQQLDGVLLSLPSICNPELSTLERPS